MITLPSITFTSEAGAEIVIERLLGIGTLLTAVPSQALGHVLPEGPDNWLLRTPYGDDAIPDPPTFSTHRTLREAVDVGADRLNVIAKLPAFHAGYGQAGLGELRQASQSRTQRPDIVRDVTGLALPGLGPHRGVAPVDVDGRLFNCRIDRNPAGTLLVRPHTWDGLCVALIRSGGWQGWQMARVDFTQDATGKFDYQPHDENAHLENADGLRCALGDACVWLAQRLDELASPTGELPSVELPANFVTWLERDAAALAGWADLGLCEPASRETLTVEFGPVPGVGEPETPETESEPLRSPPRMWQTP